MTFTDPNIARKNALQDAHLVEQRREPRGVGRCPRGGIVHSRLSSGERLTHAPDERGERRLIMAPARAVDLLGQLHGLAEESPRERVVAVERGGMTTAFKEKAAVEFKVRNEAEGAPSGRPAPR